MKPAIRSLLVLLFLAIFFLAAVGWAQYSPSLRWKTLRTPHFDIHYVAGNDSLALRAAYIIEEEVYPRVTRYFNYLPGRTDFVLNTCVDIPNGFAASFPRRMEVLMDFPSVPFSAYSDSDWLSYVALHEFVHINHLYMARGGFANFLKLFGQMNLVNAMTSAWFLEGTAVNLETSCTTGGRGRSTYHRGKLWAQLAAGRLGNLVRDGNFLPNSLPRDKPYVTGYFFLNYLRQKYGDDIIMQVSDYYSKFPFLGLNWAFRRKTGKWVGTLYKDFLKKERQQMQVYLDSLPANPQPYIFRTNERLEFYGKPLWLDNRRILIHCTSNEEFPTLYRIDLQTGRKRRVKRLSVLPSQCNGLANNKFYYSWVRPDPLYPSQIVSDIYELNLDSGKVRRLTQNAHLKSPSPSPDGRQIVAVRNEKGYSNLVLLDLESNPPGVYQLTHFKRANTLNPCWSPDGETIAFCLNQQGQQALYTVSRNGSNLQKRLVLPHQLQFKTGILLPTFTPDGRTVIFVSNFRGMENIFAFELETKNLYQLTFEPWGAYSPAISPDGEKLAFTAEDADGRHLVVIPMNRQQWKAVPLLKIRLEEKYSIFTKKEIPTYFRLDSLRPAENYNGLRQLFPPKWWLPMAIADARGGALGIFSFPMDALGKHAAQLMVVYNPKTEKPYGNLFYRYAGIFPHPKVHLYSLPVKRTYWSEPGSYWTRYSGGEIALDFPVLTRADFTAVQWRFQIGWQTFRIAGGKGKFSARWFTGPTVTGSFTRVAATYKDFWSSHLTYLHLNWQKSIARWGADYKANFWSIHFRQHLPVPIHRHHVLGIKISAFRTWGNYQFPFAGSIATGYGWNDFAAPNILTGSISYLAPLWYVEWGRAGLPSFLLRTLATRFFYSLSTSFPYRWDTEWMRRDVHSSAGGELILSLDLFEWLPLGVGWGAAYLVQERQWVYYPVVYLRMGF